MRSVSDRMDTGRRLMVGGALVIALIVLGFTVADDVRAAFGPVQNNPWLSAERTVMISARQAVPGLVAMAAGSALLICLAVVWSVYKLILARNCSLNNSVNDELATHNWRKSYQVAFFVLIGLIAATLVFNFVAGQWIIRVDAISVPAGLVFARYLLNEHYLNVAVIVLLGSFLLFDQKAAR